MESRMIKNNRQKDGINIRKRVLLPLILTLAFLLIFSVSGVYWFQKQHLEEDVAKNFQSVKELFENKLISDTETIKENLVLLRSDIDIKRAFISRDRSGLLELATPLFKDLKENSGATHLYFHDASGVNFLRVHKPGFYGDVINRKTMHDTLRSGEITSGIELGPLGTFTLRVVFPWRSNNETIGYIEVGKDSRFYIENLKRVMDIESFLFISKTTGLLDREQWKRAMTKAGKSSMWERFRAYVLVEQSMETVPPVFTEIFADEEHPALAENNRTWLKDELYHIGVIPIHDISGVEVGDLAVLIDIADHYNLFRLTIISIGTISLVTGIVLTLFFYIILGRVENRLKESRQIEIEMHKTETRETVREEYVDKIKKQNLELKLRMGQLADASEAALNMMEDANEARLAAEAAEDKVRASETRLAEAQQIAHIGNWEYDVVSDEILWSDEVYRMFGIEKEAFDHKFNSFIERIHPDDREYVQSEIKSSMDSKKPFSIDYRIVLPGGEIRYVHEEAKDISDEKGKPFRRIGTVQDITERKEAEKEIESLAKFPSENPFPVMQISSGGKILYANDASQPILNVWGFGGGRLLSTMKSFIAGVYEEGKSREVEVEQNKQTFSITFIPVKGSDYVYAYGLDVTGRKNAEINLLEAKKIAESATKAKSEFLANMSHEIRTPMTSIIGMAELLSESDLTDKEKDYVERLKGSGDALLCIINDILDLSKIESGRIDLEEIDFNVAEEIEKIISIYGVRAHDKGISLTKTISGDVQVNLRGDPVRLRQVLVNLIGNAIKFTDEGEISVSVEGTPDDDVTIFTVTDSGTGISEDKLEAIFDEFSQADSSTTRIYGGTGLGLTISRKLVELMGGEISVESEVGKGSAFCFSVRMKAGLAKKEERKKEKKTDVGRVERSLKILLVDDSEDNRLLIKTFMKGSQHSLDMAENGEEAFEKFMEKRYDLLLMDMQMPVMDGYEATKIIRRWEEDKNIKETPILAFTAHALKEEVERCIDAGCTDHLAKPVKKKELIERIRSYAV